VAQWAFVKETDVGHSRVRAEGRLFGSTIARGIIGAIALIPMLLNGVAQAADGPAGPMPDGTPLALVWQTSASSTLVRFHDPYADPAFAQTQDAAPETSPATLQAADPAPAPASTTSSMPVPDLSMAPAPPAETSLSTPAEVASLPPAQAAPPPSAVLVADGVQDEPAYVAPTPAPGEIESLRNAIVEALKSNPDIQIALARQDDAKYGVDEARAGYLPHLDMAVAIGSEFNEPSLGDPTRLRRGEGVVTLNQNLFDFGTTINDIKRARAAYRSAQWATREQIEAIAFDITTAYLDVLQRQKLVNLANESIAAHQKILKMVSIQNELGLTTPADVSRAKARLDNVQSDLLDRQSALEQSREAYRRLTLHLPGIAVDLPSPAASLPTSVDSAVDMIDDHSPRMAQAVEDRRSLERQRASQTGTFFPRIGFQAQGNWKDDVQGATGTNRDARAMVTVTYSFFNGGADIALRNRISARLREADYELDRRRREVEQDIRIDFNAMEAARSKIGTIESEIQSSEKVVDLYNQQFREGRRTVFDLLDSQQVLFAARANEVTNMTAKMVAEFRVLQKLGGLFDLVSSGEPLPPLVVPAPGRKN
jgi:TolC family type I secretion outer membrane protein